MIHVASPFTDVVHDPKKDMLDPAIEGTLNVVRSTHKAGIKRIIITSSFVAVMDLALGGVFKWKIWWFSVHANNVFIFVRALA